MYMYMLLAFLHYRTIACVLNYHEQPNESPSIIL